MAEESEDKISYIHDLVAMMDDQSIYHSIQVCVHGVE